MLFQGFEAELKSGATTIGKTSKFSAQVKGDAKDSGPWLNTSGETESVVTKLSCSGKIECDIPTPLDAGQNLLIATMMAAGTLPLVLAQEGGYTLDLTGAIIESCDFSNDGGDTAKLSFSFKNSGSFTFEPTEVG